jgi:HlyD family secretion protein
MTGTKLGVVAVLLGLGMAVLWGATRASTNSGALPPLNTVTVDRGDVSQRVVAHGSLQPVQKVTVGSQVSGIIEAIHVDFNSRVERGQVIARIESSTFAAAMSSAEAELEAAVANLELARMQWERVRQLREAQLVPVSEVDHTRAALRQAEAQVSVRRHALDRARRELDRCTIRSPTDGMVISRNVDVGQTVAASLSAPVLFEIATDLRRMQIHANVSEADVGTVREGQPVRFRVDAYRDREFTGQVIQVRNAPVVEDNVVHYETIIAVDNQEGLLKPGMTAEVNVITAEVRDAVRVRNTALRARLPDNLRPPEPAPVASSPAASPAASPDGSQDTSPAASPNHGRVYLLRDGGIEAVAVRTGLSDGLYTEILGGIAEGDELVVGLSLRTGDEREGRSLLRGNQAQY